MANRKTPEAQKLGEVQFLADDFGIAPRGAAQLVAGNDAEAEALARQAMAEERGHDPLAGQPVPGGDKDPEHVEKAVADLKKPVTHKPAAPT